MIKKIVNKFVKHFTEYIPRKKVILKFCKKNKKYWEKDCTGEKYIYIAYAHHGLAEFLYQMLLLAKGMASTSRYKIIMLTTRKDILFKKLCKSFQVDYIYMYSFSLRRFLVAFLATCKMWKAVSSGKDLLEYKYHNILIGPSVYDTILISTGRGTYEGEKNSTIFGIFFRSILLVEHLTRIFSQNAPVTCNTEEEAYESEIYRRVAKAYGVPFELINRYSIKYIDQNGETTTFMEDAFKRHIGERLDEVRKNNVYSQEVDRQLSNYYHNNMQGMKGVEVTGEAVKNKVTKTRQEIMAELNLDANKKNVFIFSHCMTDGPHGMPQLLYQDFFVWLKRTLEIASSVKSVNWIVKFHPYRFLRPGQEKIETERIIEEFKDVDNIYFFPDNYSLLSAKTLADIVVTACGTVGAEMPCYGIPVVTAGRPWYSVWGYTYSFDEVEDYERCLLEIDKIGRLDVEQINMAKCVYYARSLPTNSISFTWDDAIGQITAKAVQDREKGNYPHRVIDMNFLREMSSDNILGMMKNSEIYKAGIRYAKELEKEEA